MNKQKINNTNFTLFKLIGVYQMVDPHTQKIFGFNVYHFINIVFIIFIAIVTFLGLSGYFYKVHNNVYNNSNVDIIFVIFYMVCMMIGNFKIIIIIYNSRQLWNILEITDESFLSNTFYKRNYYKIVNCHNLLTKFFNLYFTFLLITLTLYAIVPIVLNAHLINGTTHNAETIQKINIINLRYPFTAETYNSFFIIFYATECIILFYTGFGVFALDLFSVTVLVIISAQYKLISAAFEVLEQKVDDEDDTSLSDEELLEKFISIVSDSQILYKKLKMLYDIIRPVGLVQLLADAFGMICMPYLIVVNFVEYGSFINPETLKFVFTLGFAGIQSYMYCSLFQRVTDKRDAVNFGLYCCDWTGMDIRMKKLILFTMQMNNSNKLKMSITPNECIDMPFLSTILRLSYRISSVIINSNINNLKHQ